MMKEAIYILVVALAVGGDASILSQVELPPGLTVTFGVGNAMASDRKFFYEVPMNISRAIEKNWLHVKEKPDGPKIYEHFEMYCCDEYRYLCALYDPCSTYVAGLQHGLPIEDFTENKYDMVENGFTIWKTSRGPYYTMTQYYLSELTLGVPCAHRKPYNSSVFLQEGYVYSRGTDGQRTAVSADGGQVRTSLNTPWTQQACLWWMGNHYYHKMTETLECTAKTIHPYFALVHGDNDKPQKTIGYCFMTFGKLKIAKDALNVFEVPGAAAVKMIVPKGPKCFHDMGDHALTSHSYFTTKPEWIYC